MFVADLLMFSHVSWMKGAHFSTPSTATKNAIRLAVRSPEREGSVGRVDLHHVGQLRKFPAMLGTAPGEHRPWRGGQKVIQKRSGTPKSSKSDHELLVIEPPL